MDVADSGGIIASYRVAIGARRWPTPRGTYLVSAVEWNPWWIPPKSAWAARDTVTPPGPANPMGRVKLHTGTLIYLHGTPFPASVGRAASHGCLRMRNDDAIALASLVLYHGAPSLTPDTIARAAADTATLLMPLELPARLRIVYRLVEVRGDSVHVYPDVYRIRPPVTRADVVRAIALAGRDTAGLSSTRIARLLRRGAAAPAARLVDSLTRVPRDAPPPPRGLPDGAPATGTPSSASPACTGDAT